MSAFSQFKKCLFRIEIAQDCKYNTIKQNLLDDLLELEHARSQLNEQKALHRGQGGSIRRGNKELDEIDRLDREIERVEKAIKENDKVLVDEFKNNEYEFKMNWGKKITYGQRIQFKHMFSEMYLTINSKKISHEHGCVSVQLSAPNENSQFVLLPSEKIKQVGQSVSYLDNFLIQNYVKSALDKPKFYLHVNNREILKTGNESVLEINASYESSQFKAKLYIDFRHLKYDKNHFESGDVLRLKHKEAQGYLTIFEKDVELGLPLLPDFLQRQVSKYSNSNANNQKDNGGKVSDVDQLEQQRLIAQQKFEIRKRNQFKVFIERDIQRLQYTNSCWEIQKVLTFKGGPILMNDVCRLKHIGSGKYLAVASLDRRELTLKENSDSSETLFTLHRDTYRPPNKKTGHLRPLDTLSGDIVMPHEMVILETYQGSFIHLSEKIKEEFDAGAEGDGGVMGSVTILSTGTTGPKKNHKDLGKETQKKEEKKGAGNKEGGQKDAAGAPTKDMELHEDPFRIEPLLGYFSKDDPQKMIFILEALPADSSDAKMGYQAASYYRTLYNFYCFLNLWAVIEVDEEELEILQFNGVQTDMIDKYKYDFGVSRETDGDLLQATEDIEQNVINDLIRAVSRAKEQGQDKIQQLQRHLAEQGILVLMIKLLELIYYKVTPVHQREKDLLGIEPPPGAAEDEDIPESIAKEMLDPLAEKILRLLHMLIKQNRDNAERVTRYDNIIYMMLTRYDAKQVSKIFKETYKRAQIVYGEDGEASGEAQNAAMVAAAVGGALTSGAAFGSVMKKWVDRLELIYYMNENNENLSKQILYLSVISMMCRDNEGKGLFHYQVQAMGNVLSNPIKVPITFGLQKKSIDRPIIFINKRYEETDEMFLQKNPLLRDIYKQNKTLGGSAIVSSVVLDLFELTQKNITTNGRLQPYIDWIAGVITMYCHMCLTRNHSAIQKLKEMGLTFDHVLAAISQTSSKKKAARKNEKIEPLDKKLIAAYIMAARVMYIDNMLFPSLYTYHNRCYFWETVHESDAHKTMYRWEKPKFFRGFEDNNRFLKEEQDQHEILAMGQLREHVYQFFSGMPEVLQSFLYSYESRRYTKKDVTSVLLLMFNYIDAATSLIECELVDSKFIYRMLQAAAVIFISYHYEDMPHTDEEKSWIYMVLQVAKKTKRCKEKTEILEYKTLKLLEIICRYRLNAQILVFLQLYRGYVEKNMLSHVGQSTTSFDEQFQVIFQMYQFNIGKNLTFRTLKNISQRALGIKHAASSTRNAPNSSTNVSVANKSFNNTMIAQHDHQNKDEDDDNLLRITDIVLTVQHKEENDGIEEIGDDGEVIKKGGDTKKVAAVQHNTTEGNLAEETPDMEMGKVDLDDIDDDIEDKSERVRRNKQYNDKYELDKFLLYLIFAKKTNRGMRNQAVKVLVNNFNQREMLMHELTKIELIISTQDQDFYNYFQQQHYMMRGMIEKLHQLSIEMKAAGGNGRARDILTYTSLVENLMYIMRGLSKNLSDHVDAVRVSQGDQLFAEQETARLVKKQSMLRHMGITTDIIAELMEKIIDYGFFKKEVHVDLYREVSRFLFMYCFGNLNNQRMLVPYLNFFVQLTDVDVPTPKLIAMILTQQKETEDGLKFLEFLTEKILNTKGDTYKSFLFNLLTLMMTKPRPTEPGQETAIVMQNIESNQIFVLKRLVKKNRFRKLVLLDEKSSTRKMDIVLSLNQRIREQKGFTNMTKVDQVAYIAIEWERLKLHVAVLDLISACVRNCLFGRMQARKLITAEVVFDSILSEAVPFLLRRKYLRILFEVYIRALPDDTLHLDYNTPMFHDLMFFIVYEDLRQYPRYYLGLLAHVGVEDQRDNDIELMRKRAMEGLAQKSIEDTRKRNMERTRQEMENFKDARQRLSTLQHGQAVPLIDDTDKTEYWKYLTQYKKSRNEADGLLHFIADFYKNMKHAQRKMSKEIADVTVKIREILMDMSDDLHKIGENYLDHVHGVEHLTLTIDSTLSSIPDIKAFKAGQKFQVKGAVTGAQIAIAGLDSEEEEDIDPVKAEEQRRAQQEADDSRDLDVKISSDKIINIIRDNIISEATTIRALFGIKTFEQNYIMKKLDLKKSLKTLLASQATNEEIEMFMSFLDNYSQEETEQRRTIQPDIATEGYVKIRIDPLKVLGNGGYDVLFNFRDLENLLKKALQKLQYKPPVQKRARDEMEQGLDLEMAEDDLSRACNIDLKIFTKCFFDFFQRFRHADEISDIVFKIINMFNQAYEDDEIGVVKKFIQNMVTGFHTSRDRLYLLRIFNRLVEQYLPSNPDNKRIPIKAKERLAKLQVTMMQCGLLQLLLKLITKEDIILAGEAIKMLSYLLSDSNLEVQNMLLDLMKENREIFQFFAYLKDRLDQSSDYLIKEMENKLIIRRLQIDEKKYHKNPRIESLYNTYQQPFYLPSQSYSGQSHFNLESEILRLSTQASSAELMNILKFLQMVCDNCHQGFQDYLRNQEENAIETVQPLTTVNVVSEVATILIKMTEKLGNLIFSEYIVYETVSQLFETLIDFVIGPNVENQKLLGGWKKFSKAVNFYLEQNLGVYQPNTTEQRAKLTIMKQCTDLIRELTESVDPEFRLSILKEMVPEINVKNLKNKMVEIFHFKIGEDPKKQRLYYSNKKCKHYRENTITKRANMCEQEEYCQYGHLIKFDKPIIAAGFNIFIFLYNFKQVDPNYEYLSNFDSEFKNEAIFKYKKKDFMAIVNEITNISAERQAEAVVLNDLEIEEEVLVKTEQLLQEINIKRPTAKVYPELAKKIREQDDEDGEEESKNVENNVFEGEREEQRRRQQKITSKKTAKSVKLQAQRRRWCWGKCGPKVTAKVGAAESTSKKGPNDSFEQEQKGSKKSRFRDSTSEGVQSLMDIFYEKADKYTLEQYMMDCALRFYISNVAEIEIDYNGILSKVMFRIPPYCTFLSMSSQKKMIFEANHESHIEKLEEFFHKKRVYQAEMKSIQKLARKSKLLRWISQKWKSLSNIAFGMVLVINFFFIVFYKVESDGLTVNMQYAQAELAVQLLGIIQALISFMVMLAYIIRYHGKIQEEYMEKYKMSQRERFSKVKGSLGYAFGSEVYKLAHASAIEQQKRENQKQLEDELSLYRDQTLFNKKDLIYSIRIFLIGMKLDKYHAFNVVYFILSVIGVFYNTVFSFLLLDIIIKIPLLQNVVQAIVQNRKQLFYTMILLFIVIYIYSYLAFKNLRDSYISLDNSTDQTSGENVYCRTLLECFTSTLNNGLRAGGGIGDVLNQISMDKDASNYWMRYAFDLSFFCLVIILLLNLIFGIIIDAFADMRDYRNQLETDVKERCFICGLNRFEFETKNQSWLDHVQKEHNAFAYLYFILYVQAKPGNQCNGVEKYVKALILKEDPKFFPVGRCLSIGSGEKANQEEEEQQQ